MLTLYSKNYQKFFTILTDNFNTQEKYAKITLTLKFFIFCNY